MLAAAAPLLAAVPLIAVVTAMIALGLRASLAGAIGLALAFGLLPLGFDLSAGGTLPIGLAVGGPLAEAVSAAAVILWIILPALTLYELQSRAGALERIRAALAALTPKRSLQVLLIAWFFGLFLEGAAGFGTPVALAAPLLVGLGLPPVRAVAVALLGHAPGVSFGAIGTPVFAQLDATGLTPATLAFATAALHAPLLPVVVLVVLRLAKGASLDRNEVTWGLVAAVCFALPFLALAMLAGPELATLGGALIGGGAFALLLRRQGQALLDGYAAQRALPVSVEAQRLAHLALLMCEPFRRQLPDWPEVMTELIGSIEQGLDHLDPPGPSDPALPQLATLCHPYGAQALLDAAGAGRLARQPHLVRHKAGRRALVEILSETEAGPRRWLAKTRSRHSDHASPSLHLALRAAGFDGSPGVAFRVPAALPGPEGLRTFLMEHVPGRPLADWLVPGGDTAPFRATGRALAAFHAAGVDPGRTWTAQDELAVADRALAAASDRHPGAVDRIANLRGWAGTLSRAIPSGPPVLLHRDFHPDQALVDGENIYLIDLDLAAHGDRHIDLGNLLAHLTEYGIRRFGDRDTFSLQAQILLDGYAEAKGDWSGTALEAMHALSLLRHLDICDRFPDRTHVFPAILDFLHGSSLL